MSNNNMYCEKCGYYKDSCFCCYVCGNLEEDCSCECCPECGWSLDAGECGCVGCSCGCEGSCNCELYEELIENGAKLILVAQINDDTISMSWKKNTNN